MGDVYIHIYIYIIYIKVQGSRLGAALKTAQGRTYGGALAPSLLPSTHANEVLAVRQP